MRDSLRAILERAKLEIVAEASDGWQAVKLAGKHRLDLVVMDVSMPLLNGTDAAREILAASPNLPIVLLTVHTEDDHIMFALRAGVRGYVVKTQAAVELLGAIRDVLAGGTYISPRLSGALVRGYLAAPANAIELLTPRERQVLQLVAEGKSTKEVASLLKLTTKTVDYYRSCLMSKLDIHNVAGLVRYAVRHGVVELAMTSPSDAQDTEVAPRPPAKGARLPGAAPKARVLVVHDHRVVREGLRLLFEQSGFEVIAEADARDDALQLARTHRPDLVVIDLQSGTDAIECGRDILANAPSTGVVLLTGSTDEDHIVGAMRAGIRGCVIKTQPATELVQALHDVRAGGTYLTPAVSRVVAKLYLDGGSTHDALTPRQRDVLRLIASGHSTREIADALQVSEKTVELYRARIMTRLGIHNIAALVRYAMVIGLVSA
ncbi:MAG TPA: response regulator transcription factor [Vicinamibacterales bacterium]|nr:response regulator transcription factor [Vicinamibacterales bacterium]